MTERVRISVIVPVWNVEGFLDECLESIAVQTYGDFEVVMVDDGSTDASAEICRQWVDKDMRFRLVQKVNGGPSSARNVGLENAKGEYIVFVDSDDILHKRYIETLIEIIDGKKIYSIVGTDFIRFGNSAQVDINGLYNVTEFHHYLPEDAYKKLLYQNDFINSAPWGKLFKREAIEGIWFKEGILYEDLEWMARVLEKMPKSKRVGLCDAPLYFYRKREGSLIETFSRGRLDVLDVTREIEERAVESGNKGLLRAARDRRLSANFDIYMQLWKHCRHVENGATSTENYDAHAYELVKAECWLQIKRLRIGSLINPHVRKKNKLGILLSFFGPDVCGAVGSRLIARLKK